MFVVSALSGRSTTSVTPTPAVRCTTTSQAHMLVDAQLVEHGASDESKVV